MLEPLPVKETAKYRQDKNEKSLAADKGCQRFLWGKRDK
jgi:hypothetical protein